MQLPAFFGHKRSINLLPRDAFESSTLGVVLEWALAFGKWAVILTQLVVMGAFFWRFTLDRQLTDLRKTMDKDVAIIKSYEQIERDFVLAQKRVVSAKTIIAQQEQDAQILRLLGRVMPADVWLEKLALSEKTVTISAFAGSLTGFGQFLVALQRNPMFSGITVAQIQDGAAAGAQLQFELALTLQGESKKK